MTTSSTAFRTRAIYVSNKVYEALTVLADVRGMTCADELADIELGQLLERTADLHWLINRTKTDREKRQQEYRARIAKPDDDQLP